MKRQIAIFLVLLLTVSLTACSVQEEVMGSESVSTEQTDLLSDASDTEPKETTIPTEIVCEPTGPESLPEPENGDFVRVLDYIPDIRQELAYATLDNFTGQRIYEFTDAYLRYGTVKKLAMVCEALAKQGIGLKIWDGFRPVAAQEILWEICPDPTYVANPAAGGSSHCRGNTVDVTLVDLQTGEELPVPTGFDNFTSYADRDYSDCAAEAAANALLLEQTMEEYGFRSYYAEWWHFADTEEYPIDPYFDPAVPSLWAANCQEYISLRQTAGGAVLAKIPAGSVMELHSWDGKYAKVSYEGLTGYVFSSYIKPANDNYFSDVLNTVELTAAYSYEQMLIDLDTLVAAYPDVTDLSVIGTSELGREIPVIRIGDLDAKYHVLLQGGIHGREHMTSWLMMAMADYWLSHHILSYGDVCYHIIPMSNPDGVIISQTGRLNDIQKEIYFNDLEQGHTTLDEQEYATLWKANGLGVDINRNFSSGWEYIDDRTGPSSHQYQGEKPFSSAEASCLRDYTLRYDFDTTISYHATGSMIYYEYGYKQPVNTQSTKLGRAVAGVTGYSLEGSDGVDGAGYKDWTIDALGIPSLTVEIGCDLSPLDEREIYSIFVRNVSVLPTIARWIQQ